MPKLLNPGMNRQACQVAENSQGRCVRHRGFVKRAVGNDCCFVLFQSNCSSFLSRAMGLYLPGSDSSLSFKIKHRHTWLYTASECTNEKCINEKCERPFPEIVAVEGQFYVATVSSK